jgi:hypothetical protein
MISTVMQGRRVVRADMACDVNGSKVLCRKASASIGSSLVQYCMRGEEREGFVLALYLWVPLTEQRSPSGPSGHANGCNTGTGLKR